MGPNFDTQVHNGDVHDEEAFGHSLALRFVPVFEALQTARIVVVLWNVRIQVSRLRLHI